MNIEDVKLITKKELIALQKHISKLGESLAKHTTTHALVQEAVNALIGTASAGAPKKKAAKKRANKIAKAAKRPADVKVTKHRDGTVEMKSETTDLRSVIAAPKLDKKALAAKANSKKAWAGSGSALPSLPN